MVERVLIDSRLLAQIKRNLLKHYPNEYIYALWGKVLNGCAMIHAFRELTVIHSDQEHCVYEPEPEEGQDGDRLIYLGSVHSHPDSSSDPSDADIASANNDDESLPEMIMGICGISKRKQRRFVSFGFFNKDGKVLELVVGE